MGQTKGKVKVETPLVPLVDWNFQQQPTSVTLDEHSCVDAHFITKSQQGFLVHLSEEDGQVLTLRDGRTYEVLKQLKLSELQVELSHVKTPTCLFALRDTIAIGGAGPSHLFIRWNIKKQIFKASLLRAHKDGLQQVLLFGEKLMATSSHDHSVKVWDIEKSTCVVTLTAMKNPSTIAISDSGQFCIGGKDGVLLIYDSRSLGFQPKKMEVDKTGRLGVSFICYEPQGQRMAVGCSLINSTPSPSSNRIPIAILHMEKYVLLNEWLAHAGDIKNLHWEGGILFSVGEGTDFIRLWNPDTGELLIQLDILGPRTIRMDPLRKGLLVSTNKALLNLKMTQLSLEEKKVAQEEKERKEREKEQKEEREKEEKEKETSPASSHSSSTTTTTITTTTTTTTTTTDSTTPPTLSTSSSSSSSGYFTSLQTSTQSTKKTP